MDFCSQTYILCSAFLATSLNGHQQKRVSLTDLDSSVNEKLLLIEGGQSIVKSLLSLVDDYDSRFKRSFELEPVTENLGIDTKKAIDVAVLEKSYLQVLDGLFEKQNWGRVIAMFAFLRMLVFKLVKNGHSHTVPVLVNTTSKYCDEKLQTWIKARNGWSGLIEFDKLQLLNNENGLIWGALRNASGFATGALGALGVAAIIGYIAHRI